MDILSSLTNTISLATRLREVSKNIKEAEFQDILSELSKQLSELKFEISNLKDQVVQLKEENKELRNKESDEKESLNLTAKLLTKKTVIVPPYIDNNQHEFTQNLFSIFVNIQNELVIGIENRVGIPQRIEWLFFEVCPKLELYNVIKIVEAPEGIKQFTLSEYGKKLLQAYDISQLDE